MSLEGVFLFTVLYPCYVVALISRVQGRSMDLLIVLLFRWVSLIVYS